MIKFIPVTLLTLMLMPQPQDLPDAFHRLPEPLRDKATVIVTGTFGQGRSPCMFRPDGTRFWALESWFRTKKVYRGEVGKSVYINSAMLPKTEDVLAKLEVGKDYLLLLRPNEESMKILKAGKYVPVWDALEDEEIIAIVELK